MHTLLFYWFASLTAFTAILLLDVAQVCSISPKDSIIPEVGLQTLPKAPESTMYGDYPLYPGKNNILQLCFQV